MKKDTTKKAVHDERTTPRENGTTNCPMTGVPATRNPGGVPDGRRIASGRVLMHEPLPFERDL